MSGHTEGPWFIGVDGGIKPAVFIRSKAVKSGDIARVLAGPNVRRKKAANARLIAAAPELLEALENLTLYHESGGHQLDADTVIAAANVAIAKARGNQ